MQPFYVNGNKITLKQIKTGFTCLYLFNMKIINASLFLKKQLQSYKVRKSLGIKVKEQLESII